MNLIVAADENWGIGKDGELLFHISEDLKFFKKKTTDNIIIVGRKTLESFPGGKPLPNRINIVLSRNKNYKCDNIILCSEISEIFDVLKKYPDKDVFVAGGGSVYSELLKFCDYAYVTKVHSSKEADTFIENLDLNDDWKKVFESEVKTSNDVEFQFIEYKKVV